MLTVPCAVIFEGGEKLMLDGEPREVADSLSRSNVGASGYVQLQTKNGEVYVNPVLVLFIRPLQYGE